MKFIKKLPSIVEEIVKENGAQYTAFGLFGLFNYPIYYFIWIYLSKQPYSNLLLRIIATILCLLLALNKFWPKSLKKYLPLYWYVVLLYCLPFFFTFMMIENLYTPAWVMNNLLAMYFLMLLVEFRSFVILFFIGTLVGVLLAYIPHPPDLEANKVDYSGIIVTYLVSLIIGGMFAHNREKMEQAKLSTMKVLGATVAHELRTPLVAIQFGISGARESTSPRW